MKIRARIGWWADLRLLKSNPIEMKVQVKIEKRWSKNSFSLLIFYCSHPLKLSIYAKHALNSALIFHENHDVILFINFKLIQLITFHKRFFKTSIPNIKKTKLNNRLSKKNKKKLTFKTFFFLCSDLHGEIKHQPPDISVNKTERFDTPNRHLWLNKQTHEISVGENWRLVA